MTVNTDLKTAADLILFHGWVQGKQRDTETNRICADEAVVRATCARSYPGDWTMMPRYIDALCRLADTINPEYEHKDWAMAYIAVTDWNDNHATSKQQVYEMLTKAAQEG